MYIHGCTIHFKMFLFIVIYLKLCIYINHTISVRLSMGSTNLYLKTCNYCVLEIQKYKNFRHTQ